MKEIRESEREILFAGLAATTWEAIRARSRQWTSEFEFFRFEISFLQRVLQKTSVWAEDQESIDALDNLVRKLGNLELRRDLFARIIRYHSVQVECVIENLFAGNDQDVKGDSRDLEKRIADFSADFRATKMAIFALVEKTVEEESLPYLFATPRYDENI